MACMGCCKAMRPRYKRLVDDIFPVNPEDGLVKNNMDKLTFYALSSPEKLDRIGEYLASRLSRDVARRRIALVKIAMDALDQLLVSCHDYSLNLFVESFLKMVQKLLECDELELQILATSSFVKFANIEEDTPSYHRRYDFFVSKFSAMCHSSADCETDRSKYVQLIHRFLYQVRWLQKHNRIRILKDDIGS
ncbi:protein EFR3 homolog B-like [Ruditapes philippinarum]|uniref:protein EFR3 homolog B-like n=1 Tax=Ruditapes philippinarum TaxID=129788 RepID=UPI00295A8C7D|nr:protein EFR3 homolog B-like [Ruditapes philippinarum]